MKNFIKWFLVGVGGAIILVALFQDMFSEEKPKIIVPKKGDKKGTSENIQDAEIVPETERKEEPPVL